MPPVVGSVRQSGWRRCEYTAPIHSASAASGEAGLVTPSAAASNVTALRPPVPLSELAAANRQRDALYQLSEQLHRATTSQDIYQAALDAIESALGCDRSAVLLFDDAGKMQFVAWRGLADDYRATVAGHSPWAANATDPQPIPIADVANADLTAALKSVVL